MKDANKKAAAVQAEAKEEMLITVGVTKADIMVALTAYGKRNEESRGLLFEELVGKVESTEVITKPSQLVNAFCVECYGVDNISKARTEAHKHLKDIEAIQNFVTSWIIFGEEGFELSSVNVKVKKRTENKASGEEVAVTFSKSTLIASLNKLAMVPTISNKAKALAFQLIDELG